jgi:hypothetical protein
MKLIHDTAELDGTAYFELLPGPYRNQCWNPESIYLSESDFDLIEPLFARHESQFDHFAFTPILRSTWRPIIADLKQFARDTEEATVAACVSELVKWLERTLLTHDKITVLGM